MGDFKPKKEKQITLCHTHKCEDNTFEMRVEGTTQPWFGSNVYAERRLIPFIPWKPDDAFSVKQFDISKIKNNQQAKEEARQ